MQTVVIGKNQAGQRLDKFLHKYLPEAGNSFLYKMLRKKNITLNGKKAQGREILSEGDVVESFFSEETFAKFSGRTSGAKSEKSLSLQNVQGEVHQGEMHQGLQDLYALKNPQGIQNLPHSRYSQYLNAYKNLKNIDILYEDENIIILNKPAGILTQKAAPQDLSLNEWLVGYLLASGGILEEELATFHPSVCNRLDRNTSGIVLCGKSLAGSQGLSRIIKDRSLRKFYRTICVGSMEEDRMVEGVLVKDSKANEVIIKNQKLIQNRELIRNCKVILNSGSAKEDSMEIDSMEIDSMEEGSIKTDSALNKASKGEYIKTFFHPLACQNGYTYLEVELFTGKTHQIRAQLAAMGHPIIGDFKYGDKKRNQYFKEKYGLKSQLLHACRVVFPKDGFKDTMAEEILAENEAMVEKEALTKKEAFTEKDAWKEAWGRRSLTAPCPKLFEKIVEELFPEFERKSKA